MGRFFLWVLLILLPHLGWCTSENEYEVSGNTYAQDTQRVNQLIREGKAFLQVSPADGLPLLHEAYDLSRKIKFDSGHYAAGYDLANTYRALSDPTSALKYGFEIMELTDRMGEKARLPKVYNLIGYIYTHSEEFDLAYEYFGKSRDLFMEKGDRLAAAGPVHNMGTALLSKEEYGPALQLFLDNLPYFEQQGHKGGIAATQNNIGRCYFALGDYEKALEYYRQALEVKLEMGNLLGAEASRLNIGEAYAYMGKYAESEALLLSSLRTLDSLGVPELQLDAHKYLAALYEKQGRFEKAFQHLRLFTDLKDSVMTSSNESQIEDIRKSIAYKDKELEISKLRIEKENEAARNERQQLVINLGAVGGGLVLLLALFLLRSNRKRKKANVDLAQLNREKSGLLSMVAHDLKAPLTKTQGLLGLFKERAELEPEAEKMLDMVLGTVSDGQRLIRDLLDIHQFGSQEGPLKMEPVELGEFIAGKVQSFQAGAAKKGIELSHSLRGSSQTAQTQPEYLSRILDNLISNAIKFTPRGGKVEVTSAIENDSLRITVADTGPGFSEEDKAKMYGNFQKLSARPTGGESSSGLGLAIVKMLVEKLDGGIKLDSAPGKGATFRLVLPVKRSA